MIDGLIKIIYVSAAKRERERERGGEEREMSYFM
jgi:hypothetical protein